VATTGFQGCGQVARSGRIRGLKALFAQVAGILDIAHDLRVVHGCRSLMTDLAKHIISPNDRTHRLTTETGADSECSIRKTRRIETATLGGSPVQ
jgi:hypothetical protein